jgi:4-amino-4-deoxy-L-arabinose transferase-like glycosyltransferase
VTRQRSLDQHGWRAAVLITAIAALVRLGFAAWLPLIPDETYYWDWSRHLAAGYFDHPPMIALLIRAGTALLGLVGAGHTSLAVRLVPVLAGGVASLGAAAIARRLAGGIAARTTAIILAVMPLVAGGLVLATPDAPLLAAGAGGLYGVVRAIQSPRGSPASLRWWSLGGVALGLAFASKYTSILLPVGVAVAVLARPTLRARLREPGPWVACLLATLVFAPVLYWNARHDWISFRFQLQHGLGSAARGSAGRRELDLLGGQLGLVSPILFVLLAWAVWRSLRRAADDARFTLALVATVSWVFFLYSALRKSVEANWPAPSYVPAVALLASGTGLFADSRWLRRGTALAAALSLLLLGVVSYVTGAPTIARPLARPLSRVARELAQWDGVATTLRTAGLQPTARTYLAADRYQDVSKLAFTMPGEPAVLCLCLTGRRNQYELWPTFPTRASRGDTLVAMLDESVEPPDVVRALTPYFDDVLRGPVSSLRRGADTVGLRRTWVLSGYRGGWPGRATR